MKIERTAEIHVCIGDGRMRKLEEEVSFEISGEEIMRTLHGEFNCETEHQLKTAVNLFAQFVKAVPDEMIEGLSSEARTMISNFLDGTAKRFEPRAVARVIPG
jgi:hypothetical protein